MGRRWSGDVSSTTYLAGYRLELSDVDLQGILDRDTQRTVEGAKGALGPETPSVLWSDRAPSSG